MLPVPPEVPVVVAVVVVVAAAGLASVAVVSGADEIFLVAPLDVQVPLRQEQDCPLVEVEGAFPWRADVEAAEAKDVAEAASWVLEVLVDAEAYDLLQPYSNGVVVVVEALEVAWKVVSSA